MMLVKFLRPEHFAEAFGEPLSPFVEAKIAAMDLRYRELTDDETRHWLGVIDAMLSRDLPVSGPSRHEAWERGWSEHVDMARADPTWRSLVPAYFGKYPVVRWQGRLVMAVSPDFEYLCFCALQYLLFDKWLRGATEVTEYGCGTGHNLRRIREVCPDTPIRGGDWALATQQLICQFPTLFDWNTGPFPFDFFDPAPNLGLRYAEGAAFTCAALEQVGDGFRPFVHLMLRERPAVVLHMEPIVELLDPADPLDRLSIRYAERRGYLKGFLPYLRLLEADDEVEILDARRTGIGSLFIDGYQVVVWRAKK